VIAAGCGKLQTGPFGETIEGVCSLSARKAKIIRAFGKVLFLLYVIFLIYFLFVAEWYGRTEVAEEYRYNLELFREIRRFLTYREELGTFAVFANLCSLWILYFHGEQVERFF